MRLPVRKNEVDTTLAVIHGIVKLAPTAHKLSLHRNPSHDIAGIVQGKKLYPVQILRNFIQFGGHVSCTSCAAMNFSLGHRSRRPVMNVKCVASGPNLPQRCKKGIIFENFCLECRIFGGVMPNFVGCRSAESVFWVTVKRRNISARHLGLILRFPMTSILYNRKQLALLLLLAS
jgi:hypothetical protein